MQGVPRDSSDDASLWRYAHGPSRRKTRRARPRSPRHPGPGADPRLGRKRGRPAGRPGAGDPRPPGAAPTAVQTRGVGAGPRLGGRRPGGRGRSVRGVGTAVRPDLGTRARRPAGSARCCRCATRPSGARCARRSPWPVPACRPRRRPRRCAAPAGARHTLRRDRQAISHHYDVGNDFYELVLGPLDGLLVRVTGRSPAARWRTPRRAKLDLICRKLSLRPGQRLLDVGCGWGSMVLHAVREYGVRAVGITLSTEQAAYARKRIADAGLTDRIEIRVQDYRKVEDGPFDAISSIGMAEHVGSAQYLAYAKILRRLLVPGGRLLNHQIAPPPDRRRRGVPRRPLHRRLRLPGRRTRPGRQHGLAAGGRRTAKYATSNRCASTTR